MLDKSRDCFLHTSYTAIARLPRFKAVQVLIAAALLAVSVAITCAADNAPNRVPVLLELFTSEGCSSCPPADRLLESLDKVQPFMNASLIVLSEHVDYWDRLGWKDPYSSPQNGARQQEYADKFGRDGVYTPQLVVDGRFELVGSDLGAVSSAVQNAARYLKLPIEISNVVHHGSQITAHIQVPAQGTGSRGSLYVALASDRAQSNVSRGENAGRSLSHVAVVRLLKPLGVVDLGSTVTRDVAVAVPSGLGGPSRLVVFIQGTRSGRVLGVVEQHI